MAALPSLAYLRRYALPVHYLAERHVGRASGMLARPLLNVRPRLVAAWHVDAQGRPVCRWTLESSLPFD